MPLLHKPPQIVGTIASPEALAAARRVAPGKIDFFELRVDCFAGEPGTLLKAAARLNAPLIVTVRHPAEGGQGALSWARRRELYGAFLALKPQYIDLELRSLARMESTVDAAREKGVRLIGSAHFFHSTPSQPRLAALVARAQRAQLDMCKIATLTRSLEEVMVLARLMGARRKIALSVMGMGECGKLSRLLLGSGGSALTYGYLDKAQVPGQWPALVLKERFAELA